MNPADLEAQILTVRNAKEYADFAMFTMHVHQNRYAYQAYSQDHYPADYMIELTHKLVDNGMDMYVGHGNHTMQGIEIYKGRPIFYNLGNFCGACGSAPTTPPQRGRHDDDRARREGDAVASAVHQSGRHVAQTKYQDGVLQEVRSILSISASIERSGPGPR